MRLDIKQFTDAAGLVSKITGSLLLGIKASKGKMAISGEQNGRSLTTFIPIDGKDQFELALDKSVLDKNLKGRKELNLEVDGSTVKLSARTYLVELQSQAYAEPPTLDKTGEQAIDQDQQQILDSAIPYVVLTKSYDTTTVMFFAEFGTENSRVASMDDLHFALYTTRGTARPLSLQFPASTFQLITDTSRKKDYKLAATASAICAWNSDFELVLPFVQQEASGTLEQMSELVAELKRGAAIVNVKDLCRAIESASATCEDGSPVTISIKKEKAVIQVSSQSSIGSVKERITADVSKSAECCVNPDMALDMLLNIRTDEVEMGVHADKFFYLRTVDDDADIVFGCRLAQV